MSPPKWRNLRQSRLATLPGNVFGRLEVTSSASYRMPASVVLETTKRKSGDSIYFSYASWSSGVKASATTVTSRVSFLGLPFSTPSRHTWYRPSCDFSVSITRLMPARGFTMATPRSVTPRSLETSKSQSTKALKKLPSPNWSTLTGRPTLATEVLFNDLSVMILLAV